MKAILVSLIFVVTVLAPLSARQPKTPSELDRFVSEGVHLILLQKYEEADSVFQQATMKFPHHPLGYLYRAAVLQTKSMDYLDPLDFFLFDSLLNIAKSESQKMIDEYPESPLGHFYLGTAEGYESYSRVDVGNWYAGITKGLAAASDFKKTVELDSSFYDAYVGVGAYYYWKSRKTAFLNWALGDKRAEGIRLLEIAAAKGVHNRFAALSALTAIYTDAGKLDLAMNRAQEALRSYPENRIFLWGLAAAQEQSQHFTDAAETYRHLLKNILDARISNPYDEMLCRLNLVKACLATKQTQGLELHLDAILSHEHDKFPEDLVRRARNKFEQARNIRSQLVVQQSERPSKGPS